MKMSFEEWMREVDASLIESIGMSSEEIPDWDYALAWEYGMSYYGAATRAIRDAATY